MTRCGGPALAALLLVACGSPLRPAAPESSPLAGTAWQLVRFEGGDGAVFVPDDRSKYTVRFGRDGQASLRIDCNRGVAAWRSSGAGLELGPLVLTRALCPPGSLHDQIVGQWPFIRSFVLRDGRLYLSLYADGGIYELEPVEETAF